MQIEERPKDFDGRHSLGQAGSVLIQRALLLLTGVASLSVLPRLMGPELFGQYSLATSLALWFSIMSGMGTVSMMTKFVPQFLTRGDSAGLRRFASNLLALRMAGGVLSGMTYCVLASLFLPELPFWGIAAVAGSIVGRTTANLPFTLMLGLNQASRWESGELIRRVLALLFVWAGYGLQGLMGAFCGLLVAELVVLTIGQYWARDYIEGRQIRIDLAFLGPYLRFGAAFFGGNVLVMLFHQSGETIVKVLSGDYAQAGYYHLAFYFFLNFSQAAWRLLNTFGPLLSQLQAAGHEAELRAWVERLLAALGALSVLGCAAAQTHGEMIVRLIAGERYLPVSGMLPISALGILAFVPGGIARLLAVVCSRPDSSVGSSALQFVSFGLGCGLLVPRLGATGACYAVVAAVIASGVYGSWQMRKSLDYSLRVWILILGSGALCSPILWWWEANAWLRLGGFGLAFLTILVTCGLLRWEDWRSVWSKRPAVSEVQP